MVLFSWGGGGQDFGGCSHSNGTRCLYIELLGGHLEEIGMCERPAGERDFGDASTAELAFAAVGGGILQRDGGNVHLVLLAFVRAGKELEMRRTASVVGFFLGGGGAGGVMGLNGSALQPNMYAFESRCFGTGLSLVIAAVLRWRSIYHAGRRARREEISFGG